MLAMHVTIVGFLDVDVIASLIITIVADELGHRPRFEYRFVRAQFGEVSNEVSHQFAFTFPEGGEQVSFFFWGEEVRGEDRLRGVNGNSVHGRLLLALYGLGLHGRLSINVSRVFDSSHSCGCVQDAFPYLKEKRRTARATGHRRESYGPPG